MHHTTKRRLADELVGWGYVTLLVDSFATRGIDHACTSGKFFATLSRTPDAYCALVFLARQNLRRSTTCGRSRLLASWLGLPLGGGDQFVRTVRASKQLAVPDGGWVLSVVLGRRGASGDTHAHSLGALDEWTPGYDTNAWAIPDSYRGFTGVSARPPNGIRNSAGGGRPSAEPLTSLTLAVKKSG
jgi:hypothetical protein